MTKLSYYTKEGLTKLQNELETLKKKGRMEIAQQIAEAREKGDLSENAEYDAAKDAQGLLELKIAKLEKVILNARIISLKEIDTSQVSILTQVKIKNTKTQALSTYTIVSEEEANLQLGQISILSPIGKGLLGKKVGEKVVIHVPAGKLTFEILSITQGAVIY